ncbi:MAG TPA: hypothetical protein VF221_11135 [Chloroflexota bacterium]
MAFVPTEETMARPRHTIHAAEILHTHAGDIARACAEAGGDTVVVAGVDRFLTFNGVWTVPLNELQRRVSEIDDGGWTIVFSPGADLPDIEERCMDLARRSFKRWEALRRWTSKHRDGTGAHE